MQPRFSFGQRDDDGKIVRAIRAHLGVGSIHAKTYHTTESRPQALLIIAGRHCDRLVNLFDRVPLRSKKRLEYPFWRRAVVAYGKLPGTRTTDPRMLARYASRNALLSRLKTDIASVRAYRGPQ